MANYLKNKVYKQKDKNNFLFIREKNYILEPKEDGYRSIHQYIKYLSIKGKRKRGLKGIR